MKILRVKMFKNLAFLVMAFTMLCLLSTPIIGNAYTYGERQYNFKVAASGGPSHYSEREFRNTTNTNNCWKVGMTTSTESNTVRSVTRFYLGVENSPYNAQGSEMYKVIVREEPKYYPSYTNALHKYVYLYARDDTNTNKAYTATGIWDEETGHAPSPNPWT